jgi:uncharacterized membrane protein YdjX (TVP38/TMEM64 family)
MATREAAARTPRRVILLALAGGAVGAVSAALIYSLDLSHLDAQAIATRVRGAGAAGPFTLIALLVVQAVIAPLPSPPLLMAGGFVYGPWVGFALGWVGLLLGASACFGLARAFGRPFAERFVRPARLAALDERIGTRAATTVLALVSLRVFMPPAFDAVSYACGVLRVPFGLFVLATALGEIPKVGSFTYIGAGAGGAPGWLTAWVLLVPAIGVIALRVLRSRRARADRLPGHA